MRNKNFILIIVGQIISLFGNAILRFALPLYLLGQTSSALLFGLVSACSFLPMILLSPVGGMIADRVNKRNIMVILDFSTAGLTLAFTLLLGKANLTLLILITLILLFGIQGAYQPSVQASIPLLLSREDLVKGNAVINLVSSLASLTGPVAGGALYGFYGLYPILYVSIACFIFSAAMELFIAIPSPARRFDGHILRTGYQDLRESFLFIRREKTVIWKISLIAACVNLFFSSLITIALPVIITGMLDFDPSTGERLYGYAQGVIAAGSLAGVLLAGLLAKRQSARGMYRLLILTGLTLLPIAAALSLSKSGRLTYGIILVSCFAMMAAASLLSVCTLSYLQLLTPDHMLGKVTSCTMCICMCASPLGQALYGFLLERFKEKVSLLFVAVFLITALIAVSSKKVFREIDRLLS